MSLIKKPSELVVAPTFKILVYGSPGLGKSTLSLSAPNPVLLDFDGGAHRINGAHQVPTLQVSSWQDVLDVLNSGELSEFQTIVIDTAGKMLDFMSTYIIARDPKMQMRDGSLSLKGYGARKTMFINFLKTCEQMRKHLVFVAHEREDKDGEKRFIRPEIGGSSQGDLIKELDLVGYMMADGFKRVIYWNPSDKFYAKNACLLPQWMEIPTILDQMGNTIANNDFLQRVFKAYTDYLNQQKGKRQKYDTIIERANAAIANVKTLEEANDLLSKFNAIEPIWDSKVKIESALKVKAESIGLKFNDMSNAYEAA